MLCKRFMPDQPRTNPGIDPEEIGLKIAPSRIHGNGLFTLRPFKEGSRIIEYIGERITKSESARRTEAGNPFIFEVNERTDIDGSVDWNPARFANHCCKPNCEAQCIRGHIWFIALRDIAAGEEITFNYGYDIEDYREHPCQCGVEGCVGFIIDSSLAANVVPSVPPVASNPDTTPSA